MAFDRILVPYDGSKQSDKALEHAASLARLVGSKELVLLHVVQEIPVPPMMLLESQMRSPPRLARSCPSPRCGRSCTRR